jgi:hypothetical protein
MHLLVCDNNSFVVLLCHCIWTPFKFLKYINVFLYNIILYGHNLFILCFLTSSNNNIIMT